MVAELVLNREKKTRSDELLLDRREICVLMLSGLLFIVWILPIEIGYSLA